MVSVSPKMGGVWPTMPAVKHPKDVSPTGGASPKTKSVLPTTPAAERPKSARTKVGVSQNGACVAYDDSCKASTYCALNDRCVAEHGECV